MSKRIVLIFLFVISFFFGNNVFADTTRTNSLGQTEVYDNEGVIKSVSTPSSSTTSKAPGYNVGDRVDTSDTYGNNGSLYKDGTANTTGNSSSSTTPTSTTTSGGNSTTGNSSSSRISSADYQKGIDASKKIIDSPSSTPEEKANAQKALDTYNAEYKKAAEEERNADCAASQDCLDKPSFVIETDLFSVGGSGLKMGNAKDTLNATLSTLIQKLMIALGIIALFVMTIGAGYMILYHGEDEYLSKGKNIFTGGIIALVVSLSSYYLVNLVGYILYK